MGKSNPWQDATLCPCGKRGWDNEEEADRAYRIMRGRHRLHDKSPRPDQLNTYQCRTTPGTYHIGHNRRALT